MPNPRPSPVIRFNAKILTPVKRVNKYITKNEPKIADTPTRSGMPLATSPPNTNTNKIKVNGIEIASDNSNLKDQVRELFWDSDTSYDPNRFLVMNMEICVNLLKAHHS